MASTSAKAEAASASGDATAPEQPVDQGQVDYWTQVADEKEAVIAALKENAAALNAAIKEHTAEAKQARANAKSAGGK